MEPTSAPKVGSTLPILTVILLSSLITCVVWLALSPKQWRRISYQEQEIIPSMYTHDYPANPAFQAELQLLREQKRLKNEDEVLIHRSILASTEFLKMPPAILWCLLFQESRLNHLEGIDGDRGASGLGQFSYYSFYEINHQLEKYGAENLVLMFQTLGRDVRPVEAKRKDLQNPSSYFYIPTAVVSSAAYLNNRYLNLQKILDRTHITYNSDLLWLYAAMAYNKGTRSVLSFWNNARRTGDVARVTQLLTDPPALYASFHNQALFVKVLKQIWPLTEAKAYAKELRIHAQNLRDCAISNELNQEPKATQEPTQ